MSSYVISERSKARAGCNPPVDPVPLGNPTQPFGYTPHAPDGTILIRDDSATHVRIRDEITGARFDVLCFSRCFSFHGVHHSKRGVLHGELIIIHQVSISSSTTFNIKIIRIE